MDARRLPAADRSPAGSLRIGSGPVIQRRLGSREAGLPVSGAVAVALGAGIGGGAVDVLTGSGLRVVFAISFVLGCAVAAAFVRRRGLLAAVVLPPLVYALVAAAAAVVQQGPSGGSWLVRNSLELMTALMLGAPVLVAAVLTAAVIAVVRLLAFHGAAPALRHLPRG